jgi:hypothetical protein
MSEKFQPGDRVRLNDYATAQGVGLRSPDGRVGTVARVFAPAPIVAVQWDGCAGGSRYGVDFLDLVEYAPSIVDLAAAIGRKKKGGTV